MECLVRRGESLRALSLAAQHQLSLAAVARLLGQYPCQRLARGLMCIAVNRRVDELSMRLSELDAVDARGFFF